MSDTLRTTPLPWLHLVTDYPTAQVIHVAAQLRLADLLAAGPQSVEVLAKTTGTHSQSLARLLRFLAALGIVAQEADGRVRLTHRAHRYAPASRAPCATGFSFLWGTGTGAVGATYFIAYKRAPRRSTTYSE